MKFLLPLILLNSFCFAGSYTTDLNLYKPATGDTNYVTPFATGMDTLDAAIPDKRGGKSAIIKSSWTFNYPLMLVSTCEVQGNLFSVGGSTLVISYGNVGIGTISPIQKLFISSGVIYNDGAGAGIYTTGNSTAAYYYGNGSTLTGIGDNLGSHVATMTLNMENYGINTSSYVSAGAYQINGSTIVAILPGTESIAYGIYAGTNNATTGNYNLYIGNYAGERTTTSDFNIFIGYQTGQNVTSGNGENVFLGYISGKRITTGGYNTFLGSQAGAYTTTGKDSVFVGNIAGALNTTGDQNVFIGKGAGYRNTTGWYNVCIGYNSCNGTQTGIRNTIIGFEAGLGVANKSFSSATIMGYQAGYSLTTGEDNVFLGRQAGYNVTTGSGNIIIGYDQLGVTNSTRTLNIGGLIVGDMSTSSATVLGNLYANNFYGISSSATALAVNPSACGAGQYVNDMDADGTLTCGTPSGAGDVVLSATQTFTGQNTFNNQVSLNQVIVTSNSYNTISFGGTTLGTWYTLPSWSLAISTPGVYDISLQTSVRQFTDGSGGMVPGWAVCISTSATAGYGLIACNTGTGATPYPHSSNVYVNPVVIISQYTVASALTIRIHGKSIAWTGTPVVTTFSVYNGVDFYSSLLGGGGEIKAKLIRY